MVSASVITFAVISISLSVGFVVPMNFFMYSIKAVSSTCICCIVGVVVVPVQYSRKVCIVWFKSLFE